MNLFMIPLLIMSALPTQIELSPGQYITAKKIKKGFVIDQPYLGLTLTQFSTLKSVVESSDGHCKQAVSTSIEMCDTQIEICHQTCNSTPEETRNLVKALKVDVTLLKADVKMLEGQRDVLKYIAIGASVVAVGAGGYIILK
tara:strand:+ start:1103 stop:1528 length:426 start_codon:yes stop_codon:yes gene_type:complete